MSSIPQLKNVPEINFIENQTLQETEELIRAAYIRFFKERYNITPELPAADIKSLLIKSFACIIHQVMQYIDAKGKMELLNTSTGDALEALGALFGIERKGSTRAIATERFTLSAARAETVPVPAGTRVKTINGRYFNTLDYVEIPPGQIYADVIVQAEEPGSMSSGLAEDSITILVDPIPYIESVRNITVSTGGLDQEEDDDLTERIWLAPSKFSVAGPRDAYEYWVREWRSDVNDVMILSPTPCVISIYFTMEDAQNGVPRLPTQTERDSLVAFLSGETIRPLCDLVGCYAPEEVSYTISLTYWIASSDQSSAGTIQARVAAAVEAYKKWQRTIGLDINPTELIHRIRAAGAKRVRVTAPEDIAVTDVQLPSCTGTTITYGGLEDD